MTMITIVMVKQQQFSPNDYFFYPNEFSLYFSFYFSLYFSRCEKYDYNNMKNNY